MKAKFFLIYRFGRQPAEVVFFASSVLGGTEESLDMVKPFGVQIYAVMAVTIYTLIASLVGLLIDAISGLRIDEQTDL